MVDSTDQHQAWECVHHGLQHWGKTVPTMEKISVPTAEYTRCNHCTERKRYSLTRLECRKCFHESPPSDKDPLWRQASLWELASSRHNHQHHHFITINTQSTCWSLPSLSEHFKFHGGSVWTMHYKCFPSLLETLPALSPWPEWFWKYNDHMLPMWRVWGKRTETTEAPASSGGALLGPAVGHVCQQAILNLYCTSRND